MAKGHVTKAVGWEANCAADNSQQARDVACISPELHAASEVVDVDMRPHSDDTRKTSADQILKQILLVF